MNAKRPRCAYCGVEEATTRDHVPPKLLLQEPYPKDLPTVPACLKCNRSFQADDDYTRLVLSVDVKATKQPCVLMTMPKLVRSLQRPEARGLATYLSRQTQPSLVLGADGLPLGQVIEVETARINATGRHILRGLYFLETGQKMPSDAKVHLGHVRDLRSSDRDALVVAQVYRLCSDRRSKEIGSQFSYSAGFNSQFSVWLLLLYQYFVWVATVQLSANSSS